MCERASAALQLQDLRQTMAVTYWAAPCRVAVPRPVVPGAVAEAHMRRRMGQYTVGRGRQQRTAADDWGLVVSGGNTWRASPATASGLNALTGALISRVRQVAE